MAGRPDPFRLRVLKALTAQIKTVTPARTFAHPETGEPVPFLNDLSDFADPDDAAITRARVFRGRELFGTTDPLPMVSVLEDPRALEAFESPEGGATTIGEWGIMVQGFVTDDPENPTDPAHVLSAEVVSVIAETAKQVRNILDLGFREPCVAKLVIGSPVVRPADGVNSDQAFFWLPLALTLIEDREKPFI